MRNRGFLANLSNAATHLSNAAQLVELQRSRKALEEMLKLQADQQLQKLREETQAETQPIRVT